MTTSHCSSRHQHSSDGQPGSVVWFISFGDLLTLLLCFFLVLTPWDRLKDPAKGQSLQEGMPKSGEGFKGGTTFAPDLPLRGSVVKRELPIFTTELEMEDGAIVALLEKELSEVSLTEDRIEVLICAPVEERARVAHGIDQALRRVGCTDASVRFLVTTRCDDSQVLDPVTDRYVGRVRVLGT